jgi:hypothetical protein
MVGARPLMPMNRVACLQRHRRQEGLAAYRKRATQTENVARMEDVRTLYRKPSNVRGEWTRNNPRN